MPLRIGIDFDNTIVCYDGIFAGVAREMGLLSADVPLTKQAVRDHIQVTRSNHDWTQLQAEVYGPRLLSAPPYEHAAEFVRRCSVRSIPVYIVSHKSRQPFLGNAYDLHQSALDWLEAKGFLGSNEAPLLRDRVFFAPTRADKIEQITRLGCSHFIDDLPEVFAEPAFPRQVSKILFDHADVHRAWSDGLRVRSWKELEAELLGGHVV